jgi:uncharacterized protein with HEPN domain
MRRDDLIRLRHILDAATEALRFARNRRREDLDHDRQLVWALIKAIEIIGEAASKVSQESQDLLTNIPWRNIVGMRNRLVHAYFDINLDILWKTVVEGLPPIAE